MYLNMPLPAMIATHGKGYFINKQYMVITQSDFSYLIDHKNKEHFFVLSRYKSPCLKIKPCSSSQWYSSQHFKY